MQTEVLPSQILPDRPRLFQILTGSTCYFLLLKIFLFALCSDDDDDDFKWLMDTTVHEFYVDQSQAKPINIFVFENTSSMPGLIHRIKLLEFSVQYWIYQIEKGVASSENLRNSVILQ